MTRYPKTRGGRSAIQKVLNGGKLSGHYLASVGKIEGTLRIFRLIELRKCRSVITRQAQLALRGVPLNCLRISWLNCEARDLGGGLLIHSDPFALINSHLFC